VYEIRRSTAFDAWLTNLNDSNARARIAARIDRLDRLWSGVPRVLRTHGPSCVLVALRRD
jgi:putative component of toxin-antitoxin plasmid stabilization module